MVILWSRLVALSQGQSPNQWEKYLIFGRHTSNTLFHEPIFAKKMGLPTYGVNKPISVLFVKNKPHDTKDMALHVTLECEILEFMKNFTHCKINHVDINFRLPSSKFI